MREVIQGSLLIQNKRAEVKEILKIDRLSHDRDLLTRSLFCQPLALFGSFATPFGDNNIRYSYSLIILSLFIYLIFTRPIIHYTTIHSI